jgi:cellulose synthase/poly-beta-1,6-N-acetylglucosamine synthase-like glycosyltransferase
MLFSKIVYFFFLICFIYCAFSILYLFILSFAGRFFSGKGMDDLSGDELTSENVGISGDELASENEGISGDELASENVGISGVLVKRRIAVLVPAYREDGIILSTANNLLGLDYPADRYRVYIIADSFKKETVEQLRCLPLTVLEVSFDKSTKTKSLNEAFARIGDFYDIALICDADNMLAANFLDRINAAFERGCRALQGRRVAKNLDTSFAILDACSEAINNHIFRKGAYALGLSSSVIGSGMSFEFGTIKGILGEISAVGGFDKILQLKVVERGIRIHYLEDALVFDEKVDSSHAFEQQRKRWVSSQFIYLKRFFGPACRQLLKGHFSYFNLAVANNLVLPRAFLFALLPLLVLLGFFIQPVWGTAAVGLGVLYLSSLLMGIPSSMFNKDLLKAILRLPKAIAVMVGTVFHIRKSNKLFIHTVHTKTEISNTLFNDKRSK